MPVIASSTITDSTSNSSTFTPTADFFVLCDKGEVALSVQLSGDTVFRRCAELTNGTITTAKFLPNSATKVTFVTGASYRLDVVKGPATAKAWQ